MNKVYLALIALSVSTLTAQAQWWAGGYASYWDTGDFGETFGGGFVAQRQVYEFLAIEGRGVWYEDTSGPEGEQIETATLGIGPAVTVAMNERVTGYGSIVPTLFMFARDFVVDGEEVIDDDGVDFAVVLTGGLRVELQSKWSLLAEASYNFVTVDTKAVRDGEIVDDEIDLDGFGINLGIGYRW